MAVFTAIANLIFTAGTFLASATAFVLKTAFSIGLSLALNALAGKRANTPGFAVQGKLAAGGDVPRSFLIGYSATAGSLVYAGEWGQLDETPNAYHTEVIALSDMPVRALTEVWVNAEKCTVLWSDPETPQGWPVEEYRKEGKDHLWVRFYDGTQTTADPFLTSKFGSHVRPWGASRVGRGVAYVITTALVHDELWTGFPAYRFATSGMKLYDPSRDSSVGGSGPQRWGDRSSWGGDGDDLPAVQLYNLLRGITYDGAWLYGLQGVSAARLPAADWIAQIEKCRAATLVDGVPEPTYRAGGQISVDRQLSVAVSALLTACHGRLAEIGGTYKLHCGAPEPAVFAITDGDILSSEEQSFTPFFGLADSINGVTGRYPNPAEAWAAKVAPPIYRSDLEKLDGNRRLLTNVDFDLVPYAAQVQRLMRSALEEAQRARRHTFVLPPEAFELEPGDIVSWTSERNFYGAKLFRVDGLGDRGNLDMLVDLTEVDPADYHPPATYLPVVSGPTGPVRPPPQPIYDWDAWGVVVGGDQGRERPGIRLVWGTDGLYDVSGVQFEVRRLLATELTYEGATDRYDLGRIDITANLTSSTAYQVRGRLRPASGRPASWSGWIDVLTPHAREIGRDDVVYDMLQADFRRAMDEVNRQRDELRARVEELAQGQTEIMEVINQQGTLQLDRLVSVKGNVSARIVEMREVFTDPETGFARASDLTALTAQVNDPATGLPRTRADFTTFRSVQTDLNSATSQSLTDMSIALTTQDGRITNNVNAINAVTLGLSETNGVVSGHGSSINQLTVNVDRLKAGGLLQFEAVASPPIGAISGVRMLVMASDNSVFAEAGFEAYAAVGPGGTRTAFTVLVGNRVYRRPAAGGAPVLMVNEYGQFVREGIASGSASQMRLLRQAVGAPNVNIGVGTCATNGNNGWAEMAIGDPLQVYANPGGMPGLGSNYAPVTAYVRLRIVSTNESNAYGTGATGSAPTVYVDWRVIARSGGTEIEVTQPWEFNAFVGAPGDFTYTRWRATIPQIVDVGCAGVPAGLWQFLVQWRLRMTGVGGSSSVINASDQQISISGNIVVDARFC